MKYGKVFLTAVLAVVFLASVSHAGVAGVFRLPYDSYQQWPSPCASSTMGWKVDQIFMEKSSLGYHLAEDWNGKCGGDTDKGAPLYAIADGFVEDANMGDGPTSGDSGGWLLIRHPLPDRISRWILYEHVLDILVSKGSQVSFGQLVAHLGNGNGRWQSHLHFEMRRTLFTMQGNPTLDLKTNPYYNPLPVAAAMLYSSPSLFIDDRSSAVVQNLPQGQWAKFLQSANAPGSTAFVEYSDDRFSLSRAASLGLIYGTVYFQKSDGSMWYYPNITDVFFESGNIYWVYSFYGGTRLNTLAPGHNFKEDRAKIDMIRSATANANFRSVKPETFTPYADDGTFSYSYMAFTYNNGSGDQTIYFNQATYKLNPLVRFTTYFDPATGSWTPWTQVNWNTLD